MTRQRLSADESARRRSLRAERRRQRRANSPIHNPPTIFRTPVAAAIARSLHAEVQRRIRATSSADLASAIRESNTQRRRQARAGATPQEAAAVRTSDASQHRQAHRSLPPTARVEASTARMRRLSVTRARTLGVALNFSGTLHAHDLGPMNRVCSSCRALHFANENTIHSRTLYNACCNLGKVALTPFQNFPNSLRELFEGDTAVSRSFRGSIRLYNNGLAMSSMTAQIDTPRGGGPYCFRLHGQVYHRIGALRPPTGVAPCCAQILIMDTEAAASELAHRPPNRTCDADIFAMLHRLLNTVNPYVRAFLMMDEVLRAEEVLAAGEHRPLKPVRMVFDQQGSDDQRRYNPATVNEVAVVYVGDEEHIPGDRQLIIRERSGRLQTISYLNRLCDPLTYPLLFPTGEDGWHPDLAKRTVRDGGRTRVTQKDFYSYLLHPRMGVFNPILLAGKLFQQYVVDSWIKVEMNRLNFIKLNQSELRHDTVRGLHDYMVGDDEATSGPPGRRIVLAASFAGGPRHMVAQYQDAMTVVSKYGKPDIFLTFTCNPNWSEIRSHLTSAQSASDRPDLVARVFNLKIKALCHELFQNKVFGEVAAYIYVIEFQKRGLPHMHMLITLAHNWKLNTATAVDSLISAELPNKTTDPILFEIVSKNMIHRPCGLINPTAPCMKNGTCSKRFPKQYRHDTAISVDGYPEYRRRNDGRFVMCRDIALDNRFVVPYSPYLTRMFHAHINVEVCALIHVIKYVYKYVYKGSDRAKLRIDQSTGDEPLLDEIEAYIDARYVCAPEAIHRIFGFKMQDRSVSVQRLQVHLPGLETVTFRSGEEHLALDTALTRFSTLTAFFAKNQSCADIIRAHGRLPSGVVDSRLYHYYEMPEHFVFQNGWVERKRGTRMIGRMYFVGPLDSERFALRLLLLYGKGFTSFDDVRFVNGTQHPSFVAAARAAGYLSDDSFYEQSLREAANFHMPAQLRSYFVSLIMFGELHAPVPERLWNTFKAAFIEDFLNGGASAEAAEGMALHDITERISTFGKDWHAYLPIQIPSFSPIAVDDCDHQLIGDTLHERLNDEQRVIVSAIMTSLERARGQCFFVDGPGGSGKTFLYTVIYHLASARHYKVLNVAWTGIAANLLPNGRTATSAFRLIVADNSRSSSMKRLSNDARLLSAIDLIIWDEAPMAPKQALETVDTLLRDIMQNNMPFGGKIMLLGGDFRQVLPVVERGSRSDMVMTCIKSSMLWPSFHSYTLTSNMRVETDQVDFKTWLLRLGNGELPVDSDSNLPIPSHFISPCSIIDAVFSESFAGQSSDFSDIVILTPRNCDALSINNCVLERLQGVDHTFLSEDEAIVEHRSDAFNFPTEFLNKMTPTGLPPHALHLKVGCIVMLLRNLDVTNGLCNGSRFIVQHIGLRVLICEHAAGCRRGQQVLIPRIDCYYSNPLQAFRLRRRQFPLRLSFAMTINKSQGQSFSKVGIALHDPIFSHGQLYVAFSRAKSQAGVFVEAPNNIMRNVVYEEVLS